jgi:uracil-DNA glycosylase
MIESSPFSTASSPSPASSSTLSRRQEALVDLSNRVQACRLCSKMEGRRRVLGPANGRVGAPVMFVAEAPGRLGGERTGMPLYSDQTGRNFSRLLAQTGWTRDDLFITNAILCNPQSDRGLNRSPGRDELIHCRHHLQQQIELVGPSLVVALGVCALRSLAAIAPHELRLKIDVGRSVSWWGRTLVALYHPGPRAQIHRSFEKQLADFATLPAALAIAISDQASVQSRAERPEGGHLACG